MVSRFEILETELCVVVAYRNETRMPHKDELKICIALIKEKTGWEFELNNSAYVISKLPYLNLDVFADIPNETLVFIVNPEHRAQFVEALKMLKDIFIKLNIQADDSVLLEDALSEMDKRPAKLVIGLKTYDLKLVSNSEYNVSGEYNELLLKKITEIKNLYEAKYIGVRAEINRKLSASKAYNVNFEQICQGIAAFSYLDEPCIAIRFDYHPSHYISYDKIYRLKESIRRMQKGWLIYHPKKGIFFASFDGDSRDTPHTKSLATGNLCTGDVVYRKDLREIEALKLLKEVANSMKVINGNSLANYKYGEHDIDRYFVEKYCIEENEECEGEELVEGVL